VTKEQVTLPRFQEGRLIRADACAPR
jgi:hypothetical protein